MSKNLEHASRGVTDAFYSFDRQIRGGQNDRINKLMDDIRAYGIEIKVVAGSPYTNTKGKLFKKRAQTVVFETQSDHQRLKLEKPELFRALADFAEHKVGFDFYFKVNRPLTPAPTNLPSIQPRVY